ncbi:glycosyltransferase [Ornithinimicrobium sp. LYQ121]|uniref:glycosyltransferase n=1 Tax=Ornithinimicrobium sp. LYQ121 TaxID=3378801 RepID=UPI003852F64D
MLPSVDIDVVVAVHDLDRPVGRTVLSALRGADLRGVLPSGHRVRVTVVCHELASAAVRERVERGLEDAGEADLCAHVRYLEVHDGTGSPSGPFNTGLAAATGRYVSIVGSDDRFADGALAAWGTLADELGSAWLVARLETDRGELVPTPRTRPGRTRELDLVRDRLAYRTAPLGLLRRSVLEDLGLLPEPLTPGLRTGEDVALSLRLATSGERIDYGLDLPPYLVGTGDPSTPGSRTTTTPRPVADELAAHARLLDERWVLALPERARRAIAVKTLRIHVLGAVRRRPSPVDWGPGEARWVQELTRDLVTMAPDALRALHRADQQLVEAVLTARDTDALAAASARRASSSRWDILLTSDPRANLDPEATLRAHAEAATATALARLRAGRAPRAPQPGERPRVLVLSFSPIASDARVLRQVRHLSREFDVVTCGFGPAPAGVTAHLRVPDAAQNRLDGRLITAHGYRTAYRAQAGVRWVRRHLTPDGADVILANDLDAVPLALSLRPRGGVHADLHEYFPRLHEEHAAWMRRIAPYQEWLCRRFLPRCAAVTTVSGRIAEEYAEQFGVEVGVVTNASPYADLAPLPVGSPMRLVHSGACLRNRDLHVLVDAVDAAVAEGADLTLDLYLTPNDPAYLQQLREQASRTGGAVTVHDPVPYADLVTTLHAHDVGVHVLPPLSFNNANALPNKVFDYVQARLALVVGPSPEMAALVHRHGLGVVADGFDAASLTAVLRHLDVEQVATFKAAAHAAAHVLSDAEESRRWVTSVRAIADGTADLVEEPL